MVFKEKQKRFYNDLCFVFFTHTGRIMTMLASAPTDRIEQLQKAMQAKDIAATIITATDPHFSGYPHPHWNTVQWLSGFDGSAGILAVTETAASLWTDSRYWIQAERQLQETGILPMKLERSDMRPLATWIAENIQAGQAVALDGQVSGLDNTRRLEKMFSGAGLRLRTDGDLITEMWQDRPLLPDNPVYEHDARFSALVRADKLSALREKMTAADVNWHFISTLDDIAWLLNLRGSDLPYSPLFISHMLVGMQEVKLFIDEAKVALGLQELLALDGIRLHPYENAARVLAELPAGAKVLIDPHRITTGMLHSIPENVWIVESINPSVLMKSRKAESEIQHLRETMEKDGAALCEFFSWLESALLAGEELTEVSIGNRLESFRMEKEGYVSPSFSVIAGFGANSALPHYRATPAEHAIISGQGLLLVDSGGQYPGGTTDVTRVISIGEPTDLQRQDFTVVLKGLIALSSASFPRSVRAGMLDAIARAPLWAKGLNYGHGTGHGVGYFLNVHEGPQSISYQASADEHTAMEEGMVSSIEPALYRSGLWGIRIENLVVCCQAEKTEFGDFLGFETLTLVPIDTRLIDTSLLTQSDIDWVNEYHLSVRQRLGPYLTASAKAWLTERTQAL